MGYSEENTFQKILNRTLNNELLNNYDKREGSVIYNTLAPLCLELANAYQLLDIFQEQTYLLSATGKNLDNRVYDYGIAREQATYAKRVGEFKKNEGGVLVDMDVPVGSRFAVPDNMDIIYTFTGKVDGLNILECETAGTVGNQHTGDILPVNPIANLVSAEIVDTYEYGQDEETDTALRKRVLDSIQNLAFGGNIPDYIQKVNAIDGVGNTKVFPAWNRNGGVLLSVVDPSFNPISSTFADNLKEMVDPTEYTGQGYGIAPIGHYVTITTPVEDEVDVSLDVTLESGVEIGTVYDEIEGYIQDYFLNVRKNFGQDNTLAIYRARITEAVLKCDKVLNVTSVLLNSVDDDVIYVDTETLNGQTLPYLGELTIV